MQRQNDSFETIAHRDSSRRPAGRRAPSAALAALVLILAAGQQPVEGAAASAQGAARGADRETGGGLIYGRITTTSGKTYTGRMRWDDEEASWVDWFNSAKQENPWRDEIPRRERDRRARGGGFEIFGFEISRHWNMRDQDRQFVARFGDIQKIVVEGSDDATVWMKSGSKIEVSGGSNDIGGSVTIWDTDLGDIDLKWNRIDTIEFLPTPTSLEGPRRLYGTVRTSDGSFTGTIQWDQDECLAGDELDGETDDGEVEIDMGQIRSIERLSRRAAEVTLRNGETWELRGTNDVNNENRGIFVDDPKWGRVLIHWDAFESVEFVAGPSPGYADFAPGKPLRGRVTDSDGKVHAGRIVYDIDEAEDWEYLNGSRNDIEYSIPFRLVRSVVPTSSDSARVTLRDGTEIKLEGETDVGDSNAGLLVFADGASRPTYLDWDDVERIEFE